MFIRMQESKKKAFYNIIMHCYLIILMHFSHIRWTIQGSTIHTTISSATNHILMLCKLCFAQNTSARLRLLLVLTMQVIPICKNLIFNAAMKQNISNKNNIRGSWFTWSYILNVQESHLCMPLMYAYSK